ncbi:MAG TPA: hypothetical protein VIH17_01190 [Candidatus Acidoferrales bacterium]
MKKVAVVLLVALAVLAVFWHMNREREYKVLEYNHGDKTATATVQHVNYLGFRHGPVLQLECYGSLDKNTDLSDPAYRTSPDKPATWEGAVATKHWMHHGCRPLPIGFTVRFDRQKYPPNYLDYNTAQETTTDTWFSHSYWEVKSEH